MSVLQLLLHVLQTQLPVASANVAWRPLRLPRWLLLSCPSRGIGSDPNRNRNRNLEISIALLKS